MSDLLNRLGTSGAETELIDLAKLSADGLLYRTKDEEVAAALEKATGARIVVVGTPIYRASYTGQLKAFFDLLPRDAFEQRCGAAARVIARPGRVPSVRCAGRRS